MNISNLLQYDIQNIQYEHQVANATLSAGQNQAKYTAQTQPGQLSISTQPSQLQQDSTDFFASIGLRSSSDLMRFAAQKGKQAVMEATGNYASMGRKMGQIEKGVTIAELYRQKFLQQSDTTLTVEKAAPVDLSYTPASVEMQFTPASVSIDWNVERAMREYTPPDFDLKISQHPTIAFSYLGGFQYVPPSSAPGFSARA